MPASCRTGGILDADPREADVYETGAPPPPPPLPPELTAQVDALRIDQRQPHIGREAEVPAVRPAASHEAVTSLLPGQPAGTTTYRLRGTETSAGDGPAR